MYEIKYIKYKTKYLNLKNKIKMEGGTNLNTEIQTFLDSNYQYMIYKIGLNKEDTDFFRKISVINYVGGDYSYFGDFNKKNLFKKIKTYFNSVFFDNDDSTNMANILINKLTRPFMSAINKNAFWFTIRIMKPNTMYNVNRWHTDGFFYDTENYYKNDGIQFKLVFVPVGPGTMFKKNPVATEKFRTKKDSVVNSGKNPNSIENREIISDSISDFENDDASNTEAAIFIVGNQKRAALHSEPNMDFDNNMQRGRIFISILPGTTDEIKDLARRWNVEYQN